MWGDEMTIMLTCADINEEKELQLVIEIDNLESQMAELINKNLAKKNLSPENRS